MNVETHHELEVWQAVSPSTYRRIGAAFFDCAFFMMFRMVTYFLVVKTFYDGYLDTHWRLPHGVDYLIADGSLAFFALAVEFPMTAFFGRTFGKCVFGIKVVERRPDSKFKTRALFRTVFRWFYIYVGLSIQFSMSNPAPASSIEYLGYPQGRYPPEWASFIWPIIQSDAYMIAVVIFNIVMLALLLGLHRKDRLGIHDQIAGTRIVSRSREC